MRSKKEKKKKRDAHGNGPSPPPLLPQDNNNNDNNKENRDENINNNRRNGKQNIFSDSNHVNTHNHFGGFGSVEDSLQNKAAPTSSREDSLRAAIFGKQELTVEEYRKK